MKVFNMFITAFCVLFLKRYVVCFMFCVAVFCFIFVSEKYMFKYIGARILTSGLLFTSYFRSLQLAETCDEKS